MSSLEMCIYTSKEIRKSSNRGVTESFELNQLFKEMDSDWIEFAMDRLEAKKTGVANGHLRTSP